MKNLPVIILMRKEGNLSKVVHGETRKKHHHKRKESQSFGSLILTQEQKNAEFVNISILPILRTNITQLILKNTFILKL